MTVLTGICDKCGYLTQMNSFVGNVASSSFIACSMGSCPKCGGNLGIPNTFTDRQGNAHFAQKAYDILTRKGVTDRDRLTLQRIIEKGRSQNLSVAEVKAEVNEEVPALNDFFRIIDWTANSNSAKALANLAQVLGVVLTMIAMMKTQSSPSVRGIYSRIQKS